MEPEDLPLQGRPLQKLERFIVRRPRPPAGQVHLEPVLPLPAEQGGQLGEGLLPLPRREALQGQQ